MITPVNHVITQQIVVMNTRFASIITSILLSFIQVTTYLSEYRAQNFSEKPEAQRGFERSDTQLNNNNTS